MIQFKHSNVEREMEAYGYDTVVKSRCRLCHGGCGVLIYLKDGKIEKIAGDPDCPINHGTLCSKGLAAAQLAYHPDRLTYPMKRVGPKMSGKWERITWDEALDTIAERILIYKKEYGAESGVMGTHTTVKVPFKYEIKLPKTLFFERVGWYIQNQEETRTT